MVGLNMYCCCCCVVVVVLLLIVWNAHEHMIWKFDPKKWSYECDDTEEACSTTIKKTMLVALDIHCQNYKATSSSLSAIDFLDKC